MTNTNQPETSKSILKTITIFHYAYCAAILIFGSVAIFITENANISFGNTEDIFFYLVPIFALQLAYLFLQRPTKKIIKEELDINPEKEREFQKAIK